MSKTTLLKVQNVAKEDKKDATKQDNMVKTVLPDYSEGQIK